MHKTAPLFAAALLSVLTGCSTMSDRKKPVVAVDPSHPSVVIQGVDGTTMAGELMNGSITVDSGQGELTLLTDHIHTVTLAADADKLDSDSMKVAGKVKDTRFFLKNEHGVFTLAKDRLKRIDFVNNLPKATTVAGSATTTGTVRAAAASPAR
jgi:hypothetical protein